MEKQTETYRFIHAWKRFNINIKTITKNKQTKKPYKWINRVVNSTPDLEMYLYFMASRAAEEILIFNLQSLFFCVSIAD